MTEMTEKLNYLTTRLNEMWGARVFVSRHWQRELTARLQGGYTVARILELYAPAA